MKLIIVLCLILSQFVFAEDCTREIQVQEIFYRSNPNIFIKVKNKEELGEKKNILIACELYNKIKVGEDLVEPGDNVDRIRLFSSDNGVIQRKKYRVLSK